MDRFPFFVLLFCALGCVSIDGGAVEASWFLTTYDGRGIGSCSCTCPQVSKIRFQLVPTAGGADPCLGHASCQFSCDQRSGATRFDIPPGQYAISLVPVGSDGSDIMPDDAGGCRAGPGVAPEVREVVSGRVTGLDARVVLADCAPECSGASDNRVCQH
jgi:hypothetical protein